MIALDTPGRIRTTAGFLADMERDFAPFDAFRAGLDGDRADNLDIFSADSALTTQGDN